MSIGELIMNTMVSINCIAYNQERYISDAIEGFLRQQTDFGYEILIHDDASTDRTAGIIEDYTRRYPDLIKPLYQTENQYSKGIKVGTAFNLPRAKGKYVAFCEGDDYWTDPEKLQKQVDYMESHPECSMCCHAVKLVNRGGRSVGRLIRPYHQSCLVPIEDLIMGGGTFISINSILYRRELMASPPDFYLQAPVGDIPMLLYLSTCGTVYYFDEVMSAYRTGVSGSWTDRINRSKAKEIDTRIRLIEMTDSFNRFTDYIYADIITRRQYENELLLLIARGEVTALKEERFRHIGDQMGIYAVVLIYLNKYFPHLYRKLKPLKRYLSKKLSALDRS